MDSVYREMNWLDIRQAVDWLRKLTGKKLRADDLLRLSDSKRCDVYADTDGLLGVDIDSRTCEKIVGVGIQKVLTPLCLKSVDQDIELEVVYERPAFSYTSRGVKTESPCVMWAAKTPMKDRQALFRPTDIEALAAKLNGLPKAPSAAEFECLRRELEQERTVRKAAELRAEQAEAEVEKLRQTLDAAEPISARCLSFPYATKQLEVACAAALEYWCDFDPSRPPLQKTVIGFMTERGIPARQAQELAIAIKPDDLQKA